MATKAQVFRTEQMRKAKPPKPRGVPRPRRDRDVDTAAPGVSATDRRAGMGRTAPRNRSKRPDGKGGAKLEDSATGKPSRKATRKSVGRIKRTSNLQRRAIREASSPQTRAAKAKVR